MSGWPAPLCVNTPSRGHHETYHVALRKSAIHATLSVIPFGFCAQGPLGQTCRGAIRRSVKRWGLNLLTSSAAFRSIRQEYCSVDDEMHSTYMSATAR